MSELALMLKIAGPELADLRRNARQNIKLSFDDFLPGSGQAKCRLEFRLHSTQRVALIVGKLTDSIQDIRIHEPQERSAFVAVWLGEIDHGESSALTSEMTGGQ